LKHTVIVVDDEPAAAEHVCAIIEKKCPDFKVIATANNGMECLELIRESKPEIVISDVKMPVMNGIELIKRISDEYPDILTLIVSGYQEFEYAAGALKYKAVDYIQKPVLPAAMKETLEAMSERLGERFYEARKKLIRDLTRGILTEETLLRKYFPAERYYGIMIRKNGLPRRFRGTKEVEVFSDIHESIIVYGRDEMESLYLIPYNILFSREKEALKDYAENLGRKEKNNAFYLTTIIAGKPFDVSELITVISKLYQGLNVKTIIGKNQLLFLEDIKLKDIEYSDDTKILKKLDYYFYTHQSDKAKLELKKLFELWEKWSIPQIQIEGKIWQIIYSLQRYEDYTGYDMGFEYQLEDSFYYASNMKSLCDNVESMIFPDELEEKIMKGKIDSPEFFDLIKNYIKNNIKEPISLQSVSKEFGVSQTYLSRLFRKYEEKSFNNYLTFVRMEQARELMDADKKVFIKDVANMVGYNDQFYFSRIFRSYMGVCPTDYINSIE
jgi:two-component system, response regulator YesN